MRKVYYLVIIHGEFVLRKRRTKKTVAKIIAPGSLAAWGMIYDRKMLEWHDKSFEPWNPHEGYYLSDKYLDLYWKKRQEGKIMELNYWEPSDESSSAEAGAYGG